MQQSVNMKQNMLVKHIVHLWHGSKGYMMIYSPEEHHIPRGQRPIGIGFREGEKLIFRSTETSCYKLFKASSNLIRK